MRFLATLLSVGLTALSAATPASALSLYYNFSFSGVVQSAYETGEAIPPSAPIPENQFVGQPISEYLSFHNDGVTNTGSAAVFTSLSGLVLPLFNPNLTNSSFFVSNLPGSLTFAGDIFSGSVGGFTFTYSAVNPSVDSAIGQAPILSAGRADASGFINFQIDVTSASFSVSTVPLPSGLPMFSLALLALCSFAFVTRKKVRTVTT
jgi:hypothetical protein